MSLPSSIDKSNNNNNDDNNNNNTKTTKNDITLNFSVDLLSNATKHITFLKVIHSNGISLSRPSIESFKRYHDLWLPLVFQYSKKKTDNNPKLLIPPADIAWLWHCHRLAPYRYVEHLKNQFGPDYYGILEANPPFTLQLQHQSDDDDECKVMTEEELNTQTLWKTMYPNHPFFLLNDKDVIVNTKRDIHDDDEKKKDSSSSSNKQKRNDDNEKEKSKLLLLSGFDLLSSTDRQGTFLWQISSPNFSLPEFLYDGIKNYYRFLLLRKKAPTQLIVPTYQIDLMWHTHILSSLQLYYKDCKHILNSTLHHDDSLNDRSDNSPLNIAFEQTKQLWKQQYNTEYYISGGMYRGEPPKEYYLTNWVTYNDNNILNNITKELSPIGPFLHLVNMHGASSTNPDGNTTADERNGNNTNNDTDERNGDYDKNTNNNKTTYDDLTKTTNSSSSNNEIQWTSPDDVTIDGFKGFIKADEGKSGYRQATKNPNPKINDYIFGYGSKGLGYYHITTRDAYQILLLRIKFQIESIDTKMNTTIACDAITCGIFTGGTIPSNAFRKLQSKMDNLKNIRSIVNGRAISDIPIGVVGMPQDWETNPHRINEFYNSTTGDWIFPECMYAAGGGCGSKGYTGSACGGGGGQGRRGAHGGGCTAYVGGAACGAYGYHHHGGGVSGGNGDGNDNGGGDIFGDVGGGGGGGDTGGWFGGGCGGGGCGGGGCGGGGCGGGG